MKLTLMKFSVGRFAVLLGYVVFAALSQKEFGGIFTVFLAVFLVSIFITDIQYGDRAVVHVSRSAVFGMIRVLVCILVIWMILYMVHMWLISIVVGSLSWFISAVCIFETVEFTVQKRLEKHSWKVGKPSSKQCECNPLTRTNFVSIEQHGKVASLISEIRVGIEKTTSA